MSQTPPLFNIKMVGPGVELVLEALNELPQKRVRPLFDEIAGQYAYQVQQLQAAAAAKPVEPAADDAPKAEIVEEATGLTD